MKKLLAIVAVVIIAASVIMTIIIGSLTFEGTVVNDPYTTALRWDSAHHEKVSSGWKVDLLTPFVRSPSAELIVSVTDRSGNAMKDASVELFLTRPSTDRYDSTYRMEQRAAGFYRSMVKIPLKGRWFVRINVNFGKKSITFNKTIYVE